MNYVTPKILALKCSRYFSLEYMVQCSQLN